MWSTIGRLAIDLANTTGGSAMLLFGTCCTLSTILTSPGPHRLWAALILVPSMLIANNSILILVFYIYAKSRWRIFDPFLVIYSLYLLLFVLSLEHRDPEIPIGWVIIVMAGYFVRGWRRYVMRLSQGRDH